MTAVFNGCWQRYSAHQAVVWVILGLFCGSAAN